jgi:hypothetical protein
MYSIHVERDPRHAVNKNYLILSFLVALAWLTSTCFVFADASGTSITKVHGNASILRNGQIIPAEAGKFLEPNDVIKTEEGATVDFATNGVAGTRVFSMTEVAVAESSNQSTTLNLKRGGLVLNIEKLPKESAFRVETPTAIASVRGTQFLSRVELTGQDEPKCSFAVRDGAVEVLTLGTNETFTLNEGDAIDIPKDITNPLSIRTALGSELSRLDQASSVRTCG